MKKKIIVKKENGDLSFYLKSSNGVQYLCTKRYTRAVWNYFRSGISENQLREYKRWGKNRRLDKIVTTLPMYIRYVVRYA